MKKTKYTAVLLITAMLSPLLLASCKKDTAPPPPPEVTISVPVSQEVTPYLTETGNAVASSSIDLVARVSGYLQSNNFVDGSLVKQNDLLFVIEPQPYANQVAEAQATLNKDIATYTYDDQQYQRQLSMYKRQATSLADLQQWKATRDSSAAEVMSAKANLANQKINYSYTHVTAPISGRIGRHLVDPGNLVGQGEATELATLENIDPIYVYFNINELDMLKMRKLARKDGTKPSAITKIPMEAQLQNEKDFPHKGFLDFAATELDSSTGTIQVRGILANKNLDLMPGMFVKIRIAIGKPSKQLTVPNSAVMYDQIGAYLYIVDSSDKVQQIRVATGSAVQDKLVILDGLKATDHVIVSGLQNASPGVVVKPTEKTST